MCSSLRPQNYNIYCASKKTCSFVNRKIDLPENTLQEIIQKILSKKSSTGSTAGSMQLCSIPFEVPTRHLKVFNAVWYAISDSSIKIISKFILDMLFHTKWWSFELDPRSQIPDPPSLQSSLGDPWSQRNGERALWMGGRVWLLLSDIRGPGIYKPDPAGEYTKRNLGETVYSFHKSFLDCDFWSRRLTAKSRVK